MAGLTCVRLLQTNPPNSIRSRRSSIVTYPSALARRTPSNPLMAPLCHRSTTTLHFEMRSQDSSLFHLSWLSLSAEELLSRHIVQELQKENLAASQRNKLLESENKLLLSETDQLRQVIAHQRPAVHANYSAYPRNSRFWRTILTRVFFMKSRLRTLERQFLPPVTLGPCSEH
jgi:hypothetical protein